MRTILGIDVGTYSVKVAEIQRTFKSFQFTNFYERRIQYNEVLTKEEAIAQALQAVLEDNALTWDICYTALPKAHIATRIVELPFGNLKRIEQTVTFEVEDHIPFPMEDVIFDYHVLQSTKEAAKLLVFYARKIDIAAFLAFVNNAGVEPRRLCCGGVELVNLMHMGLPPPDVPYAILDIGHETTNIIICEGRQILFTRALSIGGAQITKAVGKIVEAGDDEAERLKIELGHLQAGDLPPPDTLPNKVGRAIAEVMDELLTQVKQTFFAFREQGGGMVEGIYLCGGTARTSGIDDYISMRLQQNVAFLDCHDFHFTHVDRAEAPREIVSGALALGLRGVAASGLPDINFRQEDFQYRVDTQQLGGRVRGAALAVGMIVVLGAVYFGMRYVSLSQQLEQRNQELVKLVGQALSKEEMRKAQDVAGSVRALQGAHKKVETKITALETLTATSVLELLKRYSQAVPDRDAIALNVDKFEVDQGKLKIAAQVQSSAEVDQIRKAVETQLTEHKGDDGTRTMPPGDGGEPMMVQFLPAKTGAKGELKFEMVMQTKAAVAAEEAKKKGRGRRSARR